MAISKRANDQINYSNRKKTNSDFKNKDLRRSNCYNCDFSNSDFSDASFRGAQFKACNFFENKFDGTEFVAANLKNSRFKQAQFENAIFDSVNLEGVDFEGATFKNVVFVGTDLGKALNLDLSAQDVKVFDEMPALEISNALEGVVEKMLDNEFVKFARVLDTKEGKISPISMMILSERFDERTLIKGFRMMKRDITKDFATLSYIIGIFKAYQAEGRI